MSTRHSAALRARAIALLGLALACVGAALARENPLEMSTPAGEPVENCPDPSVIRGQLPGDEAWYMYCTNGPMGDWDLAPRLITIHRSSDLLHWTYEGDAFVAPPTWAEPGAGLWAPEIAFIDGLYHLYVSVTDTRPAAGGDLFCGWDPAIGVARSPSPTGPFTWAESPVVAPRRIDGSWCSFYGTIDAEVIEDDGGGRHIYYGTVDGGGVEVRALSADGLVSDPASALRVAAPERFEAPEVVRHDGDYYLLLSSASCCNGPLSGYLVMAGRSTSPRGPFLDRHGVSLNDARAGGTPVLAMTGDRFVGPGHNTVIEDLAGQLWTFYHAIDVNDPYRAGTSETKRPAMIDPLDFVEGWPIVRGGFWVSDCEQPDPVVSPGGEPGYSATRRPDDRLDARIEALSDEFDGPSLGAQWSWIREPSSGWALESGALRFSTQAADLHESSNNASVLVADTPEGDFVVETKVALDVPASGCCHDYVQAGLVLYGDDDHYLKLVHASIGSVRQTEWAKEWLEPDMPRYDKSWVGPPGDWTWLRVVRRGVFGGARYTALTSTDGVRWTRGATWTHALGDDVRIGLVAMNRSGYTARFDHVHVFELAADVCDDPAFADPCDDDGDGVGDLCDLDDDGDLVADLDDCAAGDPSQGRPSAPSDLVVEGGANALVRWGALASAEVYDVLRGTLSELASGSYGACFADDLEALEVEDLELPSMGDGFFYLVRGVDQGCGGVGAYGASSEGKERVAAGCP